MGRDQDHRKGTSRNDLDLAGLDTTFNTAKVGGDLDEDNSVCFPITPKSTLTDHY